MRIFDAIERLPIAIPIADVIGEDGSFEFLNEIRDKGYFDIDYRKNELIIVAGKYIGQIPLTQNVAIHVHPKVPLGNLARVIGVANHPIRCLDFFRRKYELDGKASRSLMEALAQSLVASLRDLDAEGIYREYSLKSAELTSIRGRINIPKYVHNSVPRMTGTRISCNYFELSKDTIFNRAIKRTILLLGNVLARSAAPNKKLVSELSYFADYFDSVPLDNSSNVIQQVKGLLVRERIPDLRHYYIDILDVCCIVLEGSGVELREDTDRNKLHSLIVNLEDAFECYIREALSMSSAIKAAELRVLDGNNEAKSTLFHDNKVIDAKPDLVIRHSEITKAIGDVKYKTKISEADRYQLISHALSYGAKNAFLVCPALDKANVGPVYIGTVSATNPIKVFQYRYDLEKENLEECEESLAEWVRSLAE